MAPCHLLVTVAPCLVCRYVEREGQLVSRKYKHTFVDSVCEQTHRSPVRKHFRGWQCGPKPAPGLGVKRSRMASEESQLKHTLVSNTIDENRAGRGFCYRFFTKNNTDEHVVNCAGALLRTPLESKFQMRKTTLNCDEVRKTLLFLWCASEVGFRKSQSTKLTSCFVNCQSFRNYQQKK